MHPALLPLALSVASGFLIGYFGLHPSFAGVAESSQFGGSIASIAVTMLGFMLAALAVLASINHTQLVAMMRKTGHYADLLATLFVGCFFFLACSVFGYALLFGAAATSGLLSLGAALHVGALVTILDVGRKFWLVLANLSR